MLSLACAVGATSIQGRIREYQYLTRLRSDPRLRRRNRKSASRAKSPASTLPVRLRNSIQRNLQLWNYYLYYSIYIFLLGLVDLPRSFGDTMTARIATSCASLMVLIYTMSWFSMSEIPPPKLIPAAVGRVIQKRIQEQAFTWCPTLDADAVSWLLDSLTKEEEIERFLIGIPGFYKSTQVEDPAEVLQQANTDSSSKAILAFMDRSLSSDLPEETRRRRIKVSLEAMQAHPYLLHRSFHHALRACSTESTIFKSVDFVRLADQHADDDDVKTRSFARCIITIAINRLEDYHAGTAWAGIIQRRLNWPDDFVHREHRDSIKLRNLIQLTRELDILRPNDTLRPDDETFSPEVLGHLLQEACRLNVRNAAPRLWDDFCDLWNDLVNQVVNAAQPPGRLSHIWLIMLILSRIRAVHVSLHQGTESQSPPPLANTTNVDPALQNPYSYFQCNVRHLPVASTNPSSNISLALDTGVA